MDILRLRNSTPATNWTLHFQHTFFTIPLIFPLLSTFHRAFTTTFTRQQPLHLQRLLQPLLSTRPLLGLRPYFFKTTLHSYITFTTTSTLLLSTKHCTVYSLVITRRQYILTLWLHHMIILNITLFFFTDLYRSGNKTRMESQH